MTLTIWLAWVVLSLSSATAQVHDDSLPQAGPAAVLAEVGEDAAPGRTPAIGWVRIEDTIQPAAAGFLDRALRWAARERFNCLVVELDTPGGLDTAMRHMVKAILATEVPVVMYVSPSGSRAASAGVFLMMAAHVAAMAPATNLGAAHPVAIGGVLPGDAPAPDTTMISKVTNDAVAYLRSIAALHGRNADWAEQAVRQSVSASAEQALQLGVIDLVADGPAQLLTALDGREVSVGGQLRRLHTAGARIIRREMDLRDRILGAIANPTVAYLLLLLGALGIFFELSHPGTLFPGIVGALSLLLSFFALQMLPVRAAGVALILLAIVLFILEIKVTSYGALAIGGVAALLFGSLMLFDSAGNGAALPLRVILPSVIGVAALFVFGVVMAVRAQMHRTITGVEGMVGEIGEALSDLAPGGRVFVHGEDWLARSSAPVRRGAKVRVVRVERLELFVEPLGTDAAPGEGRPR